MYKVFYNEKSLILSDKPITDLKNLHFDNESQFEEALAQLRNSPLQKVNIYHHHVEKLWEIFKKHFEYLEAAGGIVKNKHSEILFIYRLAKWDLPKGKVEEGETTESAALREIEEECGINNLKLNHFITNTYHIYFQNNLKLKSTYWYDISYADNQPLVPQIEEGIGEVKWMKPTDFPVILENTYENIKIVLEKAGLLSIHQ